MFTSCLFCSQYVLLPVHIEVAENMKTKSKKSIHPIEREKTNQNGHLFDNTVKMSRWMWCGRKNKHWCGSTLFKWLTKWGTHHLGNNFIPVKFNKRCWSKFFCQTPHPTKKTNNMIKRWGWKYSIFIINTIKYVSCSSLPYNNFTVYSRLNIVCYSGYLFQEITEPL